MTRHHPSFCGTLCVLCMAGAFHLPAQQISTNSVTASSTAPTKISDIATKMTQEAYHDLDSGNLESALQGADGAIQLDPNNASVYQLRGAIYIEKKLWDRAEADYNKALSIAPDSAVAKYKLAEIKFLQKNYDSARPRYATVQNDPNLGDLASYKVYLCDLLGRHQDRAATELAVFNRPEYGTNPSHFYANAAWALVHNKVKEANTWVSLAQEIFDTSKTDLYLSPLVNANDLRSSVVSFTSKAGFQFYKVKAFLEEDGLRISSARGWTTLPYEQLPDDLTPFPVAMRNKIMAKRATIQEANTSGVLTFTTKPGKQYKDVRVSIGENGLRVVGADGLVVIPFDQLPQDLTAFPADLREQLAAKIKAVPDSTLTPTNSDAAVFSFTTKAGKKYEHLRVSLADNGMQVLTANGWITVPYDQLPEDLAPFSQELREKIMARRQAVSPDVESDTVTFTSKKGKKYDHLRASIGADGLLVLTPNGWSTLPFADLPDDISSFPSSLRDRIAAKVQVEASSTNTDPDRPITFLTKQGKRYVDVRVSMGATGLRVLTDEGMITVPFDQLRDNLDVFSPTLRKQIEEKRKTTTQTRADTTWASFVSKRGKHYDQVRVYATDQGLRLLSSEGWVLLPYSQLPTDLSPFPADMQAQIVARQAALPQPGKATTGARPFQTTDQHGKAVAEDPNASTSLINKTDEPEPEPDSSDMRPEVPAAPTPKN